MLRRKKKTNPKKANKKDKGIIFASYSNCAKKKCLGTLNASTEQLIQHAGILPEGIPALSVLIRLNFSGPKPWAKSHGKPGNKQTELSSPSPL